MTGVRLQPAVEARWRRIDELLATLAQQGFIPPTAPHVPPRPQLTLIKGGLNDKGGTR